MIGGRQLTVDSSARSATFVQLEAAGPEQGKRDRVRIQIYDATLTEGTREAGVQLSVRDKLRIALRLAEMGVSFIEGGWPDHGAGAELFRSARRLELGGARLCACARIGAARDASREQELAAAVRSGAPAVTLRAPLTGRGEGRTQLISSRACACAHSTSLGC
jgi:2-isopropylmalate synthase